jgi:hypothetical protein
MTQVRIAWLVIWMLLTSGCEEDAAICTRDDQCLDGQHCADGRCTSPIKTDSIIRDSLQGIDVRGDQRSESVSFQDGVSMDSGAQCMPNNDDRLIRDEMPVAVGARVTFSVGTNLKVDLAGTTANGRRTWNLTQDAADEHPVISVLEPVPAWAAPSFPAATYASLMDETLGSYGVFQISPGALQLEGVVSMQANLTKLIYSQPVDLFRFPLQQGDAFVTEANVNGALNWVPLWLHEEYQVQVLAVGTLQLQQLSWPTLLVKVRLVQTPANPLLATTKVSFFFLSECYGVIGRVLAAEDPPEPLGSVTAKERWRLAM